MTSLKIEYRPELYTPPRNCPLKIGTVALMPGRDNEVDIATWENLKSNPRLLIPDLIEIGILREIKTAKVKIAKTEVVTPVVEPLKEAETVEPVVINGVPGSNSEAYSLVQETTDIELLETWLTTETRSRIKSAINRRIEALKTLEPVEV